MKASTKDNLKVTLFFIWVITLGVLVGVAFYHFKNLPKPKTICRNEFVRTIGKCNADDYCSYLTDLGTKGFEYLPVENQLVVICKKEVSP